MSNQEDSINTVLSQVDKSDNYIKSLKHEIDNIYKITSLSLTEFKEQNNNISIEMEKLKYSSDENYIKIKEENNSLKDTITTLKSNISKQQKDIFNLKLSLNTTNKQLNNSNKKTNENEKQLQESLQDIKNKQNASNNYAYDMKTSFLNNDILNSLDKKFTQKTPTNDEKFKAVTSSVKKTENKQSTNYQLKKKLNDLENIIKNESYEKSNLSNKAIDSFKDNVVINLLPESKIKDKEMDKIIEDMKTQCTNLTKSKFTPHVNSEKVDPNLEKREVLNDWVNSAKNQLKLQKQISEPENLSPADFKMLKKISKEIKSPHISRSKSFDKNKKQKQQEQDCLKEILEFEDGCIVDQYEKSNYKLMELYLNQNNKLQRGVLGQNNK